MADILVDNFNDTNGIGIIQHKADSGGGWYYHWRGQPGSALPQVTIQNNRARYGGGTGTWNGIIFHEDELSGPNYDVESEMFVAGNIGIIGRMELTEPHGYALRVTTTQIVIVKFANQQPSNQGTVLGSANHGFSNNTLHKFRLSFSGATIKAFADDVELVSVTDSDYSAGGYVGICWNSTSTSQRLWENFKVISDTASLVPRFSGAFTDTFSVSGDTNLEDHGSGNYIKSSTGPSLVINNVNDRIELSGDSQSAYYRINKHWDHPDQVLELDYSMTRSGTGANEIILFLKAAPSFRVPLTAQTNQDWDGYRLRLRWDNAGLRYNLTHLQNGHNHSSIATGSFPASGHLVYSFREGILKVEINSIILAEVDTSGDYRCRLASGGYVYLGLSASSIVGTTWIDNLSITPEDDGPPGGPCSPETATGRPLFDEFDGQNNTPLSSHTSDSGHAWIEGHGNPPLSRSRRSFFSPSGPVSNILYPMVLNGQGALVNPQAWRLRDSRQLVYAPRTSSYEIGVCFQRQDLAMPDNSLSFFWRDTSTAYDDGRGKRYELFLLQGGDMRLQKRIGNTVTVLDSDTEVFADGENNYLQILQDGNDISIKLNGSEVLSATDASILEPGTISLSINGRSLLTPYPKGFWRLNWFYVDDSYASFPVANKEVVLTDRMKALESLVKDEPDFETSHFVNVPDKLNCIENVENSVEEPNEKTIDLLEGVSISDVVAELLREETCGGGNPALFEVGSFTPQSTTGNQVINHSLGVTPKFIIVWCAGKAPGSFGATVFTCIGFSDGAANACVANTIEDNVGTSDTYRRIANNLFLMRSVTGTVVKAATLSAWSSTTFTVNHSSADAAGMTVNYLLVGGDDVEAKVGNFSTLTTTGGGLPAAQGITGVGFQPDGLLMGYVGGVGALPLSLDSAAITFGVADGVGAGSICLVDQDAQAVTNNHCGQLNDAILSDFDISTGAVTRKAVPASMDADGFTLTFTSNFNAATPVVYLAIKGLSVKVGSFNKDTGGAPDAQSVTGVGFEPSAVLMFSHQRVHATTSAAGVRLGFGGSDGTNRRSIAMQSEHNNTTSQANEITKTDKVFIVCNNDTPAIDAEADLSSFDADGFTLNWTTNHAEATEILYLALASAGAFPCDKKIIHLADHLFALDSPELSGDKGIELLEIARIQELPGVSGNSINKRLTIAEFMNTEDVPSPSREIAVSDSFSTTEVVGKVFSILDMAAANDSLDISTLLSLIETVTVSDAVAAKILIALTDSMTVSEILARFADIRDTVTLQDLITLMRQTGTLPEVARARDTVQIFRAGTAEFLPPEKTYYARDLKTYFAVERGKKIR